MAEGLAHFESQQHGEPDHRMAFKSQQRDGQLDNLDDPVRQSES